jgi:hypothetical protein
VEGGHNVTGPQLVAQVRNWLKSSDVVKSEQQIHNITREVVNQAEQRGPLPPDLAVLQALGIEPHKPKKKK